MSVCILEDRESGQAVFYCSTSGWAFGPVFEDAEQAENFLNYIAGEHGDTDIRALPERVVKRHWEEFCRSLNLGRAHGAAAN